MSWCVLSRFLGRPLSNHPPDPLTTALGSSCLMQSQGDRGVNRLSFCDRCMNTHLLAAQCLGGTVVPDSHGGAEGFSFSLHLYVIALPPRSSVFPDPGLLLVYCSGTLNNCLAKCASLECCLQCSPALRVLLCCTWFLPCLGTVYSLRSTHLFEAAVRVECTQTPT